MRRVPSDCTKRFGRGGINSAGFNHSGDPNDINGFSAGEPKIVSGVTRLKARMTSFDIRPNEPNSGGKVGTDLVRLKRLNPNSDYGHGSVVVGSRKKGFLS